MKLAIIGYGKLGKAIEEIAHERGHEIVLRISSSNADDLNTEELKKVDLALEISKPHLAKDHIITCLENNIPVVVGTTGWYEHSDFIKNLCLEKKGSLLTASNFSIGVNIFFELNKKLAQLMNHQSSYQAKIQEIHHTQKLDKPSGTAISLAEGLIENLIGYDNWQLEGEKKASALEIEALRIENIPGTHKVSYDSEIDQISIKHVAKNRKGFALGALLAAEFLKNKQGIFTMSDVLKI